MAGILWTLFGMIGGALLTFKVWFPWHQNLCVEETQKLICDGTITGRLADGLKEANDRIDLLQDELEEQAMVYDKISIELSLSDGELLGPYTRNEIELLYTRNVLSRYLNLHILDKAYKEHKAAKKLAFERKMRKRKLEEKI